ncbi:hypothetical protein P168DRAFT_233986 [Aspergillus campestris IBT 28561]|uniref:Uncharacterized protein n=1 Tax=Aspergillus campestris (strain IBT 28561) TaxID=1392248 RepID=A0A2I1D6H7_ASPC2|nr:uncharacterized protein P168DRAFT_233986 [Aspergillus campestris IBT 28561]PKY05453.1 hypothetical protein P168DRAFT_233986 [Aspergillus campestris IBT 28561]
MSSETSILSPPKTRRPFSILDRIFLRSPNAKFLGSSWSLEIVNGGIALASFASIVAVLAWYDGRPMPDWPEGITLNAILSVLTSIMKAAMVLIITEALSQLKWSWFNQRKQLSDLAVLDAASRGTPGAILVLTRFMPKHLVSLGCFVLVIAVAIAPFVQQIVAIQSRAVHTPAAPSVRICDTSIYTDYDQGEGPGMNKLPLGTTAALYSGIFQSQSTVSDASLASCPTGNCTFAPYQSLGFCSRCSNITDLLSMTTTGGSSLTMRTSNFKLPNGWKFQTGMNLKNLMNSTTGRPLLRVDTANVPVVLNFTAISSSGLGAAASATECALYFCVQTYEASVADGKFTERIQSTASSEVTKTADDPAQDIRLTPETCYVNGTKQAPDKCTYKVNWLSRVSMSNSLSPLLKGDGSLFVRNRPDWSSDTVRAVYGNEGNTTEIDSVFHSLATALTRHARSSVCHARTVTGITWGQQSFVHVRWGWLVLPGVLVVLSLIFLGITIFHTRNQFIWKSSPLALLFSGLGFEAPTMRDPTLNGMEDMSRNLNVWLESSTGGIRLREDAR